MNTCSKTPTGKPCKILQKAYTLVGPQATHKTTVMTSRACCYDPFQSSCRGGRHTAPFYHHRRSLAQSLGSKRSPSGISNSAVAAGGGSSLSGPVTTTLLATGSVAWPCLEPPFTYYASAEDAQSNATPSGLSPIWKVLLLSDGSVTRHLQLLSGAPVTVECLSMRNVGWSLEGLPAGTELIPGPRVQRQVLLRCDADPAAATAGRSSSEDGGERTVSSGSTSGRSSSAVSSSSSSSQGPSNRNGSSTSASSSTRNSRAGEHGTEKDAGASTASRDGGGSPARGEPLVYASSWWNADTVDEYLRDKSKPIWISLSQGHVELYREVHALFRGQSGELEALLGCEGPFWGRQYIFWSGGKPLTLIYEVFSPRLQQYLGPDQL